MELQGLTEDQIGLVKSKQNEACEAAAAEDGKNGWSVFNKVDGVSYFQKQSTFASMLVGKGVVDFPPHVVYDVLAQGRIEYRKELEVNLDNSKEIERFNPFSIVFLNRYKSFPFVKAREFLIFLHKASLADGYFLIATSLDSHPKCSPDPGYERATCHVGGWVIQPHSDPARSNVTYLACASLGGSLPSWAANRVAQQQPAQVATLGRILKRDHAEKANLSLYPPPPPVASSEAKEAKASPASSVPRLRSKSKKEGLIKKEGFLQRLSEEKGWETKWVKLQGVTLSCKQNASEAGLSGIIHLTNDHYLIEGPIQEDEFFVIKLVPEIMEQEDEPGVTGLGLTTPSIVSSPATAPSIVSSPATASPSSFSPNTPLTPPRPPVATPSTLPPSTPILTASPAPSLPLEPSFLHDSQSPPCLEAFRTEDRVLCNEWLHAIRENVRLSSAGKLQRKLKADRKLALAQAIMPSPASTLPSFTINISESPIPLPDSPKKLSLWRRLLPRPWLMLLLLFVVGAFKIRTKERLLELVDSCKQKLGLMGQM